jgi:hypothetical protein
MKSRQRILSNLSNPEIRQIAKNMGIKKSQKDPVSTLLLKINTFPAKEIENAML